MAGRRRDRAAPWLTVGLLALLVLLPLAAEADSWSPSRMRFKRTYPAATLLLDGRLLVTGGVDDAGTTASAEIYDAVTGRWTPAASMGAPRQDHCSTLLEDGRVLVTGGGPNAAELYDPETDAWTTTGSLIGSRSNHVAVRLRDGRVLVLGDNTTAASELYDPTTGTFTLAGLGGGGAPSGGFCAATLLPDGKVLFRGSKYDPVLDSWAPAGAPTSSCNQVLLPSGLVLFTGHNQNGTAALYDPVAQTFTATGVLNVPRSRSATLLLPDGRVLAAGGADSTYYSTNTAETYDPATGTWSVAAPMTGAREYGVGALLPNGKVVVAGSFLFRDAEIYTPDGGTWSAVAGLGGFQHTSTPLPDGRVLIVSGNPPVLYSPSAGTWTLSAFDLVEPRASQAAVLLADGRVLLTGGNWSGPTAGAEVFDPATGSTAVPAMGVARERHGAALLPSGKVLVAGGTSDLRGEIFDPAASTWTFTGALTEARQEFATVRLRDGRVMVVGGTTPGLPGLASINTAEIYDPDTGTWTATLMATRRYRPTATLVPDGRVLVTGGADTSGALTEAEVFDPGTSEWTLVSPLGTARYIHAATLLPDGRVLVTGGYDLTATALDTSEIYDATTDSWAPGPTTVAHAGHTQTLLPDGSVLVVGGDFSGGYTNAEVVRLTDIPASRRPQVTGASGPLRHGTTFTLSGTGFRGDSEAGGNWRDTQANHPLVQIRAIEGDDAGWMVPNRPAPLGDDPMALAFSRLPERLSAGWYRLTVFASGVPSVSTFVQTECNVAIDTAPSDQAVAIGATATFTVQARGAVRYHWERNPGTGWSVVAGATGTSYTTPAVTGADSGTLYRVVAEGHCATRTSDPPAVLTVIDTSAPTASVLSPSGGEYLLLSDAGSAANTHVVTWSMADNVRICRVEAALQYSNDGGSSYTDVPDPYNLTPTGPAEYGAAGTCSAPGVSTASVVYTIPTTFPSGQAGSLYRIRLTVTDHIGLVANVTSPNPFYIVAVNPDSIRTLILANVPRMQAVQGLSGSQASALASKLQELAANPKVDGLVVDLSGVTDLSDLYAAWDAVPGDALTANRVLFGCHAPCAPERDGVHDVLLQLLAAYTGVRHVVLVGDDRIIPLARLQDRTTLLPESAYTDGVNLTAAGTTVGQALAAAQYLSDDPLAVRDPVDADALDGSLYVPDLGVGRLVESPAEIATAIATFISQDGVIDLSSLDAETGHKVLVTGYDFLTDSAGQVGRRWKGVLCDLVPPGPAHDDCLSSAATSPVDATLTEGAWGLGSVALRVDALRDALSGRAGSRYALASLSGHATHFEEGVPGTDPFAIEGLGTIDLYGAEPVACTPPTTSLGSVSLAGAVVYAVGCHGGLPVPGSCFADADHSLDLPQTLLSRGVVAYVANTGFGWGLKYGIGYSERLVELFTEELTSGGTVVVGDAVRRAKQRYFLETPRYDAYDEKTLMQWTLFGLPMVTVRTGIAAGSSAPAFFGPQPRAAERPDVERIGGVVVGRTATPAPNASLPAYLTRLDLHFDFSAAGVYEKHEADGDVVTPIETPCPDAVNGCYYTLNGIVQRSTGNSDLPIQPYFIYDSRLSGTSQHGVLWKGGTYVEETGWTPVMATLQSNADIPTDHGSAPRVVKLSGIAPRLVPGPDPPQCRPSDLEVNSLVVEAGEAVKDQQSDPTYTIERHYLETDLEVLYYNHAQSPPFNCDRQGPSIGPGPFAGAYHQPSGATIEWAVPASDASGVCGIL